MIKNANKFKLECTFFLVTGTFIPMHFRSQELSFPGTFALVSENEVELSLLTKS